MAAERGNQFTVLVGTYTGDREEAVFVLRMDADTGELAHRSAATRLRNPSFLAVHPKLPIVYAVQETGGVGSVAALAFDAGTGNLNPINEQPSEGASPCHICVDATGQLAIASNYSSGSVCALPIAEDGSLQPPSDVIQHEGSSVNEQRQEGPHAHSATIDPGNQFAIACDLGIDKLMVYRLDLKAGKLPPGEPPFVDTPPGAGPRHFAFHPSGEYAYVINELGNTIIAYAYDGERGRLEALQEVPTLPAAFDGQSHTADIHVSPSGRFVYGSNRGHDSIVGFAIDEADGRLAYVCGEPSGGSNPRNFAIDPTERFLLAANQDTDSILTLSIDPETGALSPTEHVVEVPKPVCVLVIPPGHWDND